MAMQKWTLVLVIVVLSMFSALSYGGDSEREVYFYKCSLAVPRAGNMSTWGMAEGLGKTGKAARNAASASCARWGSKRRQQTARPHDNARKGA
mgnify:CR=1 FL=1